MRSVIELILAIVATIVVLLLIGLFLPGGGQGHVERSIIIERPPSHVFDVLNSFKRFNEWSPYAKIDPAASYSFEGPESGQGAMMTWSGNKEVGSGRFEIIESTPTSMVKMIQRIRDGYTGTTAFSIGTTDLGVKVTWSYDVELGANPIERIKGKYLDSSIGGDYQYGLMRLKALIESSAYARDYSDITITQVEMIPSPALKMPGLVEVYSARDFPDLNAGVADTMKKLQAFVDRNKLNITGPARVKVNLKERYRLAFDVTLPVDRTEGLQLPEGMEATETFGGQALVAEHVGERRKSNVTFEKLQAYATVRGLVFDPAQKAIEEILPDREAPKAPDADLDGATAAADEAASADEAAAGEEAEEEKVMLEVTRVYLPLGLPTTPVDLEDSAAATPADAAEPAPAGG
ncbi:MAG: SRPBCC family protein [Lysobacterales bacterium]